MLELNRLDVLTILCWLEDLKIENGCDCRPVGLHVFGIADSNCAGEYDAEYDDCQLCERLREFIGAFRTEENQRTEDERVGTSTDSTGGNRRRQ